MSSIALKTPKMSGPLMPRRKTSAQVINHINIALNLPGLAGHPACGDIMKLQIEVGEDGKTIEKAVFKV